MPQSNNSSSAISAYINHIDTLNEIGIALSAEKDYGRLLEKIVIGATQLTNADGGTLYIVKDEKKLIFTVLVTHSLNLKLQFGSQEVANFNSIPLFDQSGQPNLKNIASCCAILNKTIHISDAYADKEFDFSGARLMDKQLGYSSKSFLVVPLRDYKNKIVGVLQLINSIDKNTQEVLAFSQEKIHLAQSVASQAAIAITQQTLINAQKDLFDAFIQLIAKAIDEKSAYTSKHCARVPIIAMMLAEAAANCKEGPLKNFCLSSDEVEELRIAAWLHDCGKIVTPEAVVDKKTKLETITDRIETIDLRFEILKRDLKIALLEKQLQCDANSIESVDRNYQAGIDAINQDQAFIRKINSEGNEHLLAEDKIRIDAIAHRYAYSEGEDIELPLLQEKDIVNLSVARGTLNDEEREIVQNHARITLKMLSSLPYPDHLKNVPTIAASHHERLDGGGYPQGLKKNALSMQARIITIADIFEALTAEDRPYKAAKKLSEALAIMAEMCSKQHIDADLFALFIREKIYLTYSEKFLSPDKIDAIDELALLYSL